jgi:hypothetical protein
MSKLVRLTESKTVQVKLDATNILNHPVPNNPSLDINSPNPFGFLQSKDGSRREFRGQLRLNF